MCFFFENDGRGRELGSGETANADPAYTSHLLAAAAAAGDLRSTIRTCFGTISGSGPSRCVPSQTTRSLDDAAAEIWLLIFESSDSPRRRIVTFSITRPEDLACLRSSELDQEDVDGSDCARTNRFR